MLLKREACTYVHIFCQLNYQRFIVMNRLLSYFWIIRSLKSKLILVFDPNSIVNIIRHFFFFCGTGQNLPHYVMMCLVYTTWMSCRGVGNGLISVIRARGWRYLLLALIDVEACTLITSSHQFTSLASIQVYAVNLIILYNNYFFLS